MYKSTNFLANHNCFQVKATLNALLLDVQKY